MKLITLNIWGGKLFEPLMIFLKQYSKNILLPNTESLGILERNMKNMIKKYGITSTRSHFYTKPEKEVKDFKVLDDVVSDHLPLFLEFV